MKESMESRTYRHDMPYPGPQPEDLASAETAATLVPTDELLTEDSLVRHTLYVEMQRLRDERNRALSEAEAWRQGSLIAVAMGVAMAVVVFWPF